jgi:hypothetical protein
MISVNEFITYILSFFFDAVKKKKDIEIQSSLNNNLMKEEDFILDEYNTCIHAQFDL